MADQQMNDDVLDRAVREALDVAPSPDFVARVRTRIANEPAPRGGFSGWMMWTPIAACATAAAIALAVWVERPAQQVRLKPDPTEITTTEITTAMPSVRLKADPTESIVAAPNVVVPVGAGFSRPVIATPRPVVASHKEPEILISPAESAALRRLIARASEGQIVVNDSTPPASALGEEIKPLPEIEPVKIDPIVPVNGEEGVRQ